MLWLSSSMNARQQHRHAVDAGRLGGLVKSRRKKQTSRINGLKGGRPKKKKACPRLRTRVWSAIKQNGGPRSIATMALVGCTVPELKAHLDATHGGSDWWKQKRLFHIDHIVPFEFFDVTIEDHQRICCNWRNLRVIGQHENLSNFPPVFIY